MMPYQNPSLPEEMRVADLLARLTLEETLAPMRVTPQIDRIFGDQPFTADRVAAEWPHGLGGTYSADYFDPIVFNAFQKYFVEQTRLGIPLLLMSESIHGVMSRDTTVFPQAIGLGATFNPGCCRDGRVIGQEHAPGHPPTFAPT